MPSLSLTDAEPFVTELVRHDTQALIITRNVGYRTGALPPSGALNALVYN